MRINNMYFDVTCKEMYLKTCKRINEGTLSKELHLNDQFLSDDFVFTLEMVLKYRK